MDARKIDPPITNDNYTLPTIGAPYGATPEQLAPRQGAMPYDCARGVHVMVQDQPRFEQGKMRRRAHCIACPYEAIEPLETAPLAPKVVVREHSTQGNAVAYKLPDGRTLVISAGPSRADRRRKR